MHTCTHTHTNKQKCTHHPQKGLSSTGRRDQNLFVLTGNPGFWFKMLSWFYFQLINSTLQKRTLDFISYGKEKGGRKKTIVFRWGTLQHIVQFMLSSCISNGQPDIRHQPSWTPPISTAGLTASSCLTWSCVLGDKSTNLSWNMGKQGHVACCCA